MGDNYDPKLSEAKWQKYWEENKINEFDFASNAPIYSIDTPPPTVSGKIHIGHIFSYTQAEVIARYKRMRGYNVFYPFGFDDNGLPTEILVEKETGKKATEIGRVEFGKECIATTEFYAKQFKQLWQSIGLSVDWRLDYSTISPKVQRISQLSFLNLYKKGIIYKKDTPALWCHKCGTSVAQAEVEDKELDSVFYDIIFKLENGKDLVIATTRPELLPACVAVFVNPKDERYTSIIGNNIVTPLGNIVKVMSDEKVALDKGTGAVMCCTYGDETDMYWVSQYNLEEKIILDEKGTLINTGNESLDGLYLLKGRKVIIEILDNAGLIVSKKPIIHAVGTHERCGTPMEIISVPQWFISIMDKKQQLLDMGNQINWYPDHMKKRYDNWVQNLKWDWCISRQRYFGIPIPAWRSKLTGELILADESQLPIDPLKDKPLNLPKGHTIDDIVPETDVLDTWATSSLTPLINSNWMGENSLVNKLMPMSLRPQAHDIIRTWAFYTIVMSYFHTGNIPFQDIMVSGHVLAGKGEKISKSKGNAKHTPESLIEEFGADPVRYWACGGTLGNNVVFDELEIKAGRKLVTKLWNAARFVFMNLEGFDQSQNIPFDNLQLIDKGIISKLTQTTNNMQHKLDGFEFGLARKEFEIFFWSDFCDDYLEIVKDIVYNFSKYENGDNKKLSAQYGLYVSLLSLLKLISPILPHITEEIYQKYFKEINQINSIHKCLYPDFNLNEDDVVLYSSKFDVLKEYVAAMRKAKADSGKRLGEEVQGLKVLCNDEKLSILKEFEVELLSVAKAKGVQYFNGDDNIQVGIVGE
ncbi:MAG: valine--tRNA ligase [Candidatus Absconditabacteria bacterium]